MSTAGRHPDWFDTARPTVENTLHVALDTLKDVQARAELDSDLAADVANTIEQIEKLLSSEGSAA